MNFLVVGGAGFIVSYIIDYLVNIYRDNKIGVYDNFSARRHWYLREHASNHNVEIIHRDI
jgi:dTDP-D-glucose 4,6-dehydratase